MILQSCLKGALRNLRPNKIYTLLNIAGLVAGTAVVLFIAQYVVFEHSYETFIPRHRDLYRVYLERYQDNVLKTQSATIFPALAPAILAELPEAENSGRLVRADGVVLRENARFNEERIYHADASIPAMFGLQFLRGDANTALANAGAVIISETMARKYFGDDDPLGKTLKLSSNTLGLNFLESYLVQGVFRDQPANTHLKMNMLFSYQTFARATVEPAEGSQTANVPAEQSWDWYDFYTYVLLKPAANTDAAQAKLSGLAEKYKGERLRSRNRQEKWVLQPVRDIHLHSDLLFEAEPNGNAAAVNMLVVIAVFVLGVAWINYVNLATARAVDRAREVGIRKVAGATRGQLVWQFMIESWLLNMIAFVLAIALVEAANPLLWRILGQEPQGFLLHESGSIWLFGSALILSGGVMASLYPAAVLSGLKPVFVLKGRFKSSPSGLLVRKGLMIFQFGVAVAMIAGTLIISQQLNFMRNQKLGFAIEQTLVLKSTGMEDRHRAVKAERLKTALLKLPGVKSAAVSTAVPGDDNVWATSVGKPGAERTSTIYTVGVDEQFLPSFEFGLAAGRFFSKEFQSDERAAILNMEALRLLEIATPEQALAQRLVWRNSDTLTVVGVLAPFHNRSLKRTMDPVLFRLIDAEYRFYSLKVHAANLPAILAEARHLYNDIFPEATFEYFFLDEFFDRQYRADERFGYAFGIFATLAIVVACLGLLGSIIYAVSQRTKEVGIRKVLGASAANIAALLSLDFLKLVAVASIVAAPIAWLAMNRWLQDFAHRVDIGWEVFALSAAAALLIALAIVSTQAIRAALANPVEALRHE